MKLGSRGIVGSGKRRFFVTTPCHYPLSKPTIAQAYPNILADVLARYARLRGQDPCLLVGTDEFGFAMTDAAALSGLSPAAMADRNSERLQRLWRTLGVDWTYFVRTTEKRHTNMVMAVLTRLWNRGDIFERLIGEANCVEYPNSTRRSGYFFRLSRYRQRIIDHIHNNPNFIRPPSARTKALRLLRSPSPDPVISRTKLKHSWGIDVPFAPHHIVYVWFDGLIGYLAPLLDEGHQKGTGLWPPDMQIIGIDLIQTHAVYWPALLMALELDLPRSILFHGSIPPGSLFQSVGDMAPDLGLAAPFGDFDVDILRGVLCKQNPLSRKIMAGAVDENLVEVTRLVEKLDQVAATLDRGRQSGFGVCFEPGIAVNETLRRFFDRLLQRLDNRLAECRIDLLIEDCRCAIDELSICLQDQLTRPWADAGHLANTVSTAMECADVASALLYPVMPGRMARLRASLDLPAEPQLGFFLPRFDCRFDLYRPL